MDIKLAPDDPQSMSQDGDSILRSLQNNSLPIIDLMVRESLQNSLDATLEDSKQTCVDFKLGKFNSTNLSKHLTGVTDVLDKNYQTQQEFIAISDKNTTGLTGDFRSKDLSELNKSNFQKLIFGIGKNQEAEGAGGSWGLGKTSYFRLGIGIVIYYTRVAIANGYEDRLIASLIESPKQENRLLPESGRGIAWWGNHEDDRESIYPLVDKKQISEILNIFDLELYGEETGTTIIVPYIKPIEDDNGLPFENNKDKVIQKAVERWYSPRLLNLDYSEITGNSFLRCSVNDTVITPGHNTEPIFDKIGELYTAALTQKSNTNIQFKPIHLKKNGMESPSQNPVGWLAFEEVTRESLKMTPPDNKPSGLAYIGVKDLTKIANNYSQIIAYSRKPGMIVEYSIDGEWTPSKAVHQEDTLLIGFFVPNSQGKLIEKYELDGYKNLESYLRATENADHANWLDKDGYGIIRGIKRYVSNAISESFQEKNDNGQTSATSALSRKFGKQFLPPKSFGKTSSRAKVEDKNKRDVSNRNRVSDIRVLYSKPSDTESVKVGFKAFIKKESKNSIFLQVLTQEKRLDKENWDKTMEHSMEYPFKIKDFRLLKIEEVQVNDNVDFDIYDLDITVNSDGIALDSRAIDGIELEGELVITMNSDQFIPNLAISSER